MQKGFKHTKETKEKMRVRALSRDNSNRIKSLPKGEDHWRWNKDLKTLSKVSIHRRLHRKYGPASNFKCIDCDKKALDYSNEEGNYTDDIKDYKPRCRSCHLKKDGYRGFIKPKKTK